MSANYRIKRKAREVFLKTISDYTVEQRRILWPPAKALKEKHIQNCRLITNREELLKYVPQNGVCAEIGIDKCRFTKIIFQITKPKKLHLFDISAVCIDIGKNEFKTEISKGRVFLHPGDSSTSIKTFPASYFDWVYIDGDHTYEGCKKDLEAVRLSMKEAGLILLNDYIYFSPSDFMKYGVIEAVNEFCLNYNYEILFLALQGRGYNDVLLRKLEF